jgi:hypothetical protein
VRETVTRIALVGALRRTVVRRDLARQTVHAPRQSPAASIPCLDDRRFDRLPQRRSGTGAARRLHRRRCRRRRRRRRRRHHNIRFLEPTRSHAGDRSVRNGGSDSRSLRPAVTNQPALFR